MNKNKNNRNINLDIIRTIALLMLVCVHFILNNDFYNTLIIGEKMYISVIFRNIFMTCVPLFILLTGYLMNKKTLSKKYFFNIKKIIINYIIAMIIIYVFRILYYNTTFSLKNLILMIVKFEGHAWYVNMYIGLYLVIPFLNIGYNHLSNKNKKILIIILIILTTLPSIFNIYNYSINDWFYLTKVSDGYTNIFPNWWVSLYPITYYFIGAYLSEYKQNIKSKYLIILLICSLFAFGTFNYFRSRNTFFEWGLYTDWGSFQNVLISVILFVLILNINTNKMNIKLKKIFSRISDLSYSAYLVTPIFELYFYDKLKLFANDYYGKIKYIFILVPLIFILSLVLSFIISKIYVLILNCLNFIISKVKLKKIHFELNKIICFSSALFLIFAIVEIFYLNYSNNKKLNKYSYLGWKRYSEKPILEDNDSYSLFDPNVILIDGKYYMYLSQRKNKSISLSISSDGINWSEPQVVLSNNLSSGWEDDVNRATVVKYNNKYLMYYTGQKDGVSKIGLAVSDDGVNFERYSENPILEPEFEYESYSVMNPFVMYDYSENIFKMWYSAGETFEPDVIGYATSIDGINFKKYANNPIVKATNDSEKYDSYKIGGCDVHKINENKYIMFYIGYTDIDTARILYATSNNGIDWNMNSKNPILAPNKYGFDSEAVYKASAIYNENEDKWYLWYNGRNLTKEAIGLAICDKCKFDNFN